MEFWWEIAGKIMLMKSRNYFTIAFEKLMENETCENR